LEVQQFLSRLPTTGELIRGGNGCRKLRWNVRGGGERGGVRVVYYWVMAKDQIMLLTAYSKTSTADLTPIQIRKLGQLISNELKVK